MEQNHKNKTKNNTHNPPFLFFPHILYNYENLYKKNWIRHISSTYNVLTPKSTNTNSTVSLNFTSSQHYGF